MRATAGHVAPLVDTRSARRRDLWWVEPLSIVLGLVVFIIYAAWAALQVENYEVGPYLSPFHNPFVRPGWWPFSPAILIVWVPVCFRLTCYYSRGAYYRSFFWDPPACAVGELRKGYHGERRFPFILQNLHRYFLYLAAIEIVFLWYDAVHGFLFPDGFGIGIGSLVLLGNVTFLSLYLFSCHSFRHLSGGCEDCLAAKPARLKLWRWVSALNTRHPLWFWVSLSTVALADLYIRLVASGAITDMRFF